MFNSCSKNPYCIMMKLVIYTRISHTVEVVNETVI